MKSRITRSSVAARAVAFCHCVHEVGQVVCQVVPPVVEIEGCVIQFFGYKNDLLLFQVGQRPRDLIFRARAGHAAAGLDTRAGPIRDLTATVKLVMTMRKVDVMWCLSSRGLSTLAVGGGVDARLDVLPVLGE